jgi:EAL domain-containing protein (putative c-di-GMP-specific phosphodiesterase class I)
MATNQLVLHCQPTVDCHTGEVVAAEMLVRWRHPTRGLIPPGAWVPTIESSRVAAPFNLHVLGLAVRLHEQWTAAGIDVPLSVNVTPACLASDRFVASLVELFGGRLEDGAIHLEITERTTEINTDALRSNVEDLAELGFRILLDDFGAGYSSLVRLANLPVATLKIDSSLVADITWREAHALIVDTVIRLTHDLGQSVVGEGVENDATWAMLRSLGCDVIQGYGVARPMLAEDFPAFLETYVPAPPELAERRRGADRRGADRRRLARL